MKSEDSSCSWRTLWRPLWAISSTTYAQEGRGRGGCNWGVSRKFHTPWATLTRVPAGLCLTCTARCCVAEMGRWEQELQRDSKPESESEWESELPVLLSMPGRWLRVRYLISGRKLRGNVATSTNISSRQATYRTYIFISRRGKGRGRGGQNTTL